LAVEAAKMASDGMGVDELAEKITGMRKKVNEFCTLHSLKTMHKAGRVTGATAFFGNLLGVKPILICNADGEQMAYKKVKGRVPAIKECINLLKENIIDPENQTIYLWHSDCDMEEVKEVEAMLREAVPCKDVYIGLVGPIVGASVGPSVIGFWAFGKEVTFVSEG
jgi:DegV family protein with EDD domain